MRIALLLAAMACTPAMAQDGGPEGPETVPAIVSRKAVDEVRHPWYPAGTMAPRRGHRAAAPLKIDYDRDGTPDTARLVSSGVHSGVEVTSGRTGRRRIVWLIDDTNGLAPDAYLKRSGTRSIEVVFPESTSIILFLDGDVPMATYMNG